MEASGQAAGQAVALPRERARTGESRAARIGRAVAHGPLNVLLVVLAVLWLVPTLGLMLTSLMPATEITQQGWWNIVSQPSLATFENYKEIFNNQAITSALWTTVQIAVGNTVLLVVVASLAGYAFAWLDFPGRDWLFVGVIALLVVPLQVALIPIFTIYQDTGLFDTVLGLVLFHVAFGLPFGIFLMRNFFIGIPRDIMESARIDGASEWRIFTRLILPLGLPAIASLAIFQFLWTWNDLIVALTYGRNTQPLTVAIFSQTRQFGSNIELIAPASFLSLAIPLLVFLAFQRFFVQGLLAGSVK
ncbi:MAG TPA: carbohydrate ABC transporter permease [Conexibacter sp.]|nr:carbohydrate ABC transporter permease [Conexibacter sp.]